MEFADLLSALNLNSFISFDLETTGLSSENDKIIEIAAQRFENGEPTSRFTTLIHPKIPIPEFISNLTSITNEMVMNAPVLDDKLQELLDFFESDPVVGQNIDFDLGFLKKVCIEHKKSFPEFSAIYDTSTLSRNILYFHHDFSLSGISTFYNQDISNAHRALADTLNTGHVFMHLVKETASKPLSLLEDFNQILYPINAHNQKLYENLIHLGIKQNNINGIYNSSIKITDRPSVYISNEKSVKNQDNISIEDILGNEGLLKKGWDWFEPRECQISFSENSLNAFINKEILIAEAGTGLGKSFSYLSACLLYSGSTEIPVVISTHTKHLQEQLFHKDIPSFSKKTGVPVKAAIIKGRRNYLCKTRFKQFLKSNKNRFSKFEQEMLLPLLSWNKQTKSGDIEECPGFPLGRMSRIWKMIRSEPGYCTTARCRNEEGCYYGKLRKQINETDLLIVNHALLVNEVLRENSILPPEFILVIDEAHNLSPVTRDQLTIRLTADNILYELQFFTNKNDLFQTGFFHTVKKFTQDLEPDLMEMSLAADGISKIINEFYVEYLKKFLGSININNVKYEKNVLIENPEMEFSILNVESSDILDEFKNLIKLCRNLEKKLKKEKDFPNQSILDFNNQISIIEGIMVDLSRIFIKNRKDIVWSRVKPWNNNYLLSLCCAPKDVSSIIHDAFFTRENGTILCSATLELNNSFNFINQSVGLMDSQQMERTTTRNFGSPFHYDDQVDLWSIDSGKSINSIQFIDEIGSQLCKLASATKKRMLILCTSYEQVKVLSKHMSNSLRGENRKVFAQTIGQNRRAIIRGFNLTPASILIGTMSFWEGVDFPGKLVEILVILKIPFDNPDDPVLISEIKNYKMRNKNPFMEYQVPCAAVKFKQGFGRLIRSITDSGICILTDPRLINKHYGKYILDSLPVKPKIFKDMDEIIENSVFLNKKGVPHEIH